MPNWKWASYILATHLATNATCIQFSYTTKWGSYVCMYVEHIECQSVCRCMFLHLTWHFSTYTYITCMNHLKLRPPSRHNTNLTSRPFDLLCHLIHPVCEHRRHAGESKQASLKHAVVDYNYIQAQISLENVYVESPGRSRLDNTSFSNWHS